MQLSIIERIFYKLTNETFIRLHTIMDMALSSSLTSYKETFTTTRNVVFESIRQSCEVVKVYRT